MSTRLPRLLLLLLLLLLIVLDFGALTATLELGRRFVVVVVVGDCAPCPAPTDNIS